MFSGSERISKGGAMATAAPIVSFNTLLFPGPTFSATELEPP